MTDKALWFVQDGDVRGGPFDTVTVRALLRTGRVSHRCLVWRLGMASWAPAGTVPGFRYEVKRARESFTPRRTEPRRHLIMVGGGFSFGFFGPTDVNLYLHQALGNELILASGSERMTVNMVPRLTLTYSPIEYVQLEVLGELGWSPKTFEAESIGYKMTFDFMRYSVGGTVSGVLPMFDYRAALRLGVGVMYHHMTIEGYAADTAGFRASFGVRFYFLEPVVLELAAFFDYAKATDPEPGPVPAAVRGKPKGPLTMDYTGGGLGLNIYYELFGR
jgi:hypothetical protein